MAVDMTVNNAVAEIKKRMAEKRTANYSRSKHDLGSKLDLALRASLRLERRSRHRCERTARRALVRNSEIRMIGEVKDFCSDLQGNVFGEAEGTRQSQIEVLQTITAQNIPSRIAECANRIDLPSRLIARPAVSLRAICQQRARVEPAVGRAFGYTPITNKIGAICCCSASRISPLAG